MKFLLFREVNGDPVAINVEAISHMEPSPDGQATVIQMRCGPSIYAKAPLQKVLACIQSLGGVYMDANRGPAAVSMPLPGDG